MALFKEDMSAHDRDKNLGFEEFRKYKQAIFQILCEIKTLSEGEEKNNSHALRIRIANLRAEFFLSSTSIFRSEYLKVRLTAFINSFENELLRRHMTSADEDRTIDIDRFMRESWESKFNKLMGN